MGDVVNLNQYRKDRAREKAARQARENRIRHGRPGGARSASRRKTEQAEREHEGKKLGPEGADKPAPDSPEDSNPSAG